jgi:hypothetical protein
MKKMLNVLGVIFACFVLVLLALRVTGLEPHERMPGLWLTGDLVTTPVADWSYTDRIPEIKIQTQTPFLLPHSVTIWCAAYNGNLYVTSARGREWVEDMIRDPHVRLKIADKVYDRTVSVVDDPAEKAAVLQARVRKYPQWKGPPDSALTVFRVNPT